jgi:ER-bound oxygenase mpaB/B'/Rubber oxygenase, catalytic domain
MTEIPSRFRHPVNDPDPALVAHYRRLFAHGVGVPLPEQVSGLAHALQRADPLADAWCADSRGGEGLFELALQRKLPRDAPASLRALFEQLETIPLWVDADKLRLGARTARRPGLIGNFVLADFALMGGYRSAAIAKTLVSTGKLSTTTAKRLIHTGRFVHAVSVPGAILPGGAGYLQTVRVRMVHAHVRHALLESPGWDRARWGIPINQADSLGTNLLFSTGFLEGCKQWGLRFTNDEEEALVHLWRYVGYLMGIEESLLPVDAAGGRRALFMVGVSQPSPDEDSRKLARALYEVPLTFQRSPALRRAARFEMALRLGMTRRLLGDESVDQLGLPRSPYGGLIPPIVGVIRGVERVRVSVPGATAAAYRVGDYAIRASQRLGESALAAHEARSA